MRRIPLMTGSTGKVLDGWSMIITTKQKLISF
jgi:hypothetical protein